MGVFSNFGVEIQNLENSDPEHFNGSITTASTPSVITPTNTRPITLIFIQNPGYGPNANPAQRVLLYSLDGGSTYTALARNESVYVPGVVESLYIDSPSDNTNYEIIVWS